MDVTLDLSRPGSQIIVVVVFLIPGLLYMWTFERLAGRTRLKGTERLLRAVAWSTFLYAVASPWLLSVGQRVANEVTVSPWEMLLGAVMLMFLLPVACGFGMAQFRWSESRNALLRRFTAVDPTPTSWDFIFTAGGPYFVRARLRSGERVGGFFGDNSVASSYPEAQDLYLEEAWRLAGDGTFLDPLPGTRGLLLTHDDLELIELFSSEGATGRHHAKPP
jgi:hypothetical protein